MVQRTVENFDLLIQASGSGYRAVVRDSPVGEVGPVPVTIPLPTLELENLRLRIGPPGVEPASGTTPAGVAAIRQFGRRLFDAAFHDDVRLAWRASIAHTEGRESGLRLRLRLADAPELADLPWELLYDVEISRFLALWQSTPVVRFVDLPGGVRSLTIDRPLRVLVLRASPTDLEPVDARGERSKVGFVPAARAVDTPEPTRGVVVHHVQSGTLADLQAHLRRREYHVLHFIGHGSHDPLSTDGVLALEGTSGPADWVTGVDLGAVLADHRSLRLAVLDSGAGGRSATDSFASVARSLVQQGIPAVVATQFAMSDGAARTFATTLYRRVADGYPLDAAVTEGRHSISDELNAVEWAAPVLYLRAPDARIFEFAPVVLSNIGRPAPRMDQVLEAPSAPRLPELPRVPPTVVASPPASRPAPASSAPASVEAPTYRSPPAGHVPLPPPARAPVGGRRRPRYGGRIRGRATSEVSTTISTDPYASEAIEKAVQSVLRPGRLLFNPPDDMRQGTVERIEVAIARTTGLDDELRAGLRGRGVGRIEDVATSPFMAVDLRGTGFEITPLSLPTGMEQLLHPTARWEFDVLPRRSGTRTLQVIAWMRVPLPSRPDERMSVPVLERTVQVRVAPLYATRTFAATNWQWLVATSVAAGGGVAAWIKLVG
jgi:hypothetical protein